MEDMEIYKIGSRGEVVRQIQKALHIAADGIYGKLTAEAVTAFQREHGLKPDGIVGPATRGQELHRPGHPCVAQGAWLRRHWLSLRRVS